MTRPCIALIGPITNGGTATQEHALERLREAVTVGTELVRLGFSVSLPHWSVLQWEQAMRIPHAAWMRNSLAQIDNAHVVYRLPGESPGVDQELGFCEQEAITVVYSLNEAERWIVTWRRGMSAEPDGDL